MRIGIDFDNTIVSYDDIFHEAAGELGLIGPGIGRDKTSVRDHLRGAGREKEWIILQGHVYGACMDKVSAYPGALDFVSRARDAGHDVKIISHKTRHANMGPRYDLHAAAKSFLTRTGFVGAAALGAEDAYFEITREAKLERIVAESCDVFIDDLPELLTSADFPRGVARFLFDPHCVHSANGAYTVLRSWHDAMERLVNQ